MECYIRFYCKINLIMSWNIKQAKKHLIFEILQNIIKLFII